MHAVRIKRAGAHAVAIARAETHALSIERPIDARVAERACDREIAACRSCLQRTCAGNACVRQLPGDIAKTGGIQSDGARDRRPQHVVLIERAGDLDRCAGALI